MREMNRHPLQKCTRSKVIITSKSFPVSLCANSRHRQADIPWALARPGGWSVNLRGGEEWRFQFWSFNYTLFLLHAHKRLDTWLNNVKLNFCVHLIMAARQLAGRRPLYFTADVSILLLPFFRRLISEVSGPIVTKLCHMFGGDCNFLMWVKKLGGPSPQKFGGPKTSKFLISPFNREYLRTGTRYRPSENGVENCNHSPTCIRNLVNFGPQMPKNSTFISTYSIDFFGRSYLRSYLRS